LPELGRLERVSLWLSLQRYALLLVALAMAPLLLVGSVGPRIWWAWLLALLITARVGAFAVMIWRRWPAKIHTLRVAMFRVTAGRFDPEQIRRHCGDPCFRLVAHACLRRAGLSRRERRRVVGAYAAELRAEGSELLIIDHIRGEVSRTTGGRTSVARLHSHGNPELSPSGNT